MKNKITNISILLINILLTGILVSCGSDGESEPRLHPTLSSSTIEIEVGDSTILQVLNAQTITSVSTNEPEVVSLSILGTDIMVTALAEGHAYINVNIEGVKLNCKVIVTASPVNSYDFNQELQNERCRFVSPSLSIYYDTPGTIFSIVEGNVVEIYDLSTGDQVVFNSGTSVLSEGELPNAILQINGNTIELKQKTLEALKPDGSMWLNLLDVNDNRLVLVVTDL